jgi:hypothetical protein
MLNLKLSSHARTDHQNEKWNGVTIREAYENGQLSNVEVFEGRTADHLYGVAPDGTDVGLVISKPKLFGPRIVITGYAASKSYWQKT